MSVKNNIRKRIESKELELSPYAQRSADSAGRKRPEESCGLRTNFQRDRDRIIHSKAFRRLKHKTQVFISPQGDHYVTRLTHTLEVSQIARTISRSLNLNEDLTEAIALGHDLGHTPFGHVGEDEMDVLIRGDGEPASGFRHAWQSLRVVEVIEREGMGLNLTEEVRNGIKNHSKPKGDFMSPDMVEGLSLEAQIVRISDAVAYLNHDLLDAFRADILSPDDLPDSIFAKLGASHGERIDTIVNDIVKESWEVSGIIEPGINEVSCNGLIKMSLSVRDVVNEFRNFMFKNVYMPEDKGEQGLAARAIIRLLFNYYSQNPDSIPSQYSRINSSQQQAIVDYISGMTDQYAINTAESMDKGIGSALYKGVS
ncbi:MAG: deoxyguanosinetriphosphate triphosphohydrolase [Dehalococcoidia bacterium]|nr:deoxyguanosinetriphosphate triphosphohydrolase [Dehalococcoidia bacterium]MQG15479.1 deoxyguanosinetriphosphate triphosphohydrolase [SAR202 cluster bacterium]|tara:strand:+ start:31058 stop:32164 length:1107 start_codon:yes stop_codon:yes gene_type:complete